MNTDKIYFVEVTGNHTTIDRESISTSRGHAESHLRTNTLRWSMSIQGYVKGDHARTLSVDALQDEYGPYVRVVRESVTNSGTRRSGTVPYAIELRIVSVPNHQTGI